MTPLPASAASHTFVELHPHPHILLECKNPAKARSSNVVAFRTSIFVFPPVQLPVLSSFFHVPHMQAKIQSLAGKPFEMEQGAPSSGTSSRLRPESFTICRLHMSAVQKNVTVRKCITSTSKRGPPCESAAPPRPPLSTKTYASSLTLHTEP
jgi:hypothetical protein